MKRMCLLLAGVMFWSASPAFALFENGGFETGDFTGWALEYGRRAGNDTKTITWGYPDHGLRTVMDNTATMPGQTLDIDPYNGQYMARINDIGGNYHATKIWQQDAISQQDVDNGAMLYVNWGTALIEPSNYHPEGAQPYFGINVWVGGVLQDTFQADALDHDATWVIAGNNGGPLWYRHETWSYDLSAFSVGDPVRVEMFVSDCGWGGHGGYAFLDGIGTINPSVPAPGALLLAAARHRSCAIGSADVGWFDPA